MHGAKVKTKNLLVPQKMGNFLASWVPTAFSVKTLINFVGHTEIKM
jgi:hypothetical protein